MNCSKVLVCIDFDHTLMDCNTDLEIKFLTNGKPIPEEIEAIFKDKKGWTKYMQEIFKFLHKNNVSKEDYINLLTKLPLVSGMKELLHQMHESGQCEIVIMSDANSFFVQCILEYHQLDKCIIKVFTNPAEFDKDGCLLVKEFQNQTTCARCPQNMCKGIILANYLSKRQQEGEKFLRTLYIGDGSNDVCPALMLGANDYIFAREGYRLLRSLEKMPAKDVKATVIPWETAYDIRD